MKVSVNQIIKQLLIGLPERQKEILDLRYGLSKPNITTLAEIGGNYGVTRERVRQLESLALKEVRQKTADTDLPKFVQLVSVHLKDLGGVAQEDSLIEYLEPVVELIQKELVHQK